MTRVAAVASTVAVLLLAGCGGTGEADPTVAAEPTISSATPTPSDTKPRSRLVSPLNNKCLVVIGSFDDSGASITFDTEGEEESSGDTFDTVMCALEVLEAPTYVTEHITSTRALDGQQEDEWDGFKARWTYHPDDGLVITLVDTRAI